MRLVVGRIGRPHGVRGEVAVEVRTDAPEERFVVGRTLATDPDGVGPLTITAVRRHGDRLLVRFAEVADRTAAEELRGVFLVVDSSEVPPLDDPDEFHDHELIGLRVETTAGEAVGEIVDILHHAQDTLVITGEAGTEVLVPFVRALVPEVDTEAGRVVIDPPPGLLELGQ
ncbi:ribosome maturation factor RimM [Thermobifida alba]|uniref:Ribosome maturation factor RimM n=1 Tax=Thermobifida alba TaxID=53522 RepID=A0ABY4L644_THEAE|nr:ribosome maturation factor RimM [Thermobifida alba]UPT23160.1 ribosome maturation factor RimM [Thermobifida alba]